MTAKLDTKTLHFVRQKLVTELEHQTRRHGAHLAEYHHDWPEQNKVKWRERLAEIYGQQKELAAQMHNLTKLIQANQ